MSRVITLSAFIVRDLARSLAVIIPPVLTLGVYQATFLYSGTVDYMAAVGGADLAFVALVITLLLVSRVNRAATYPWLARLGNRTELLAAVVASALVVSLAMSILFAALALGVNRVVVTPLQLLLIAPRWLVLQLFAITLGLNMGKLVSRGGSYLVTIGVVALMVTVTEQRAFISGAQDWLLEGVAVVAAPITSTVLAPVQAPTWEQYLVPQLLTGAYALGLFVLAAWLLHGKDLLWAE